MLKIDSIAEQIVREDSETLDKPQTVVVGMFDEWYGAWQWHRYEFVVLEMNRYELR